MYRKINFSEAKSILDSKPNLMILDVREEEEYITGHAVGATLFTLADINEESAKAVIPSKDTPLLIYCRSGRRSRLAAQILEELGYKELYDVGGLIGWPYGIE